MKNIIVAGFTALDIENQVEKVLRGLGNPEPPLCLDQVRELLKLDRHYYSSSEQSVLREVASKLRIAGKQVLARPSLLGDAIKKFDLRSLYLPDRKRILIDETLPVIKQRWSEAHEVGHDLIPWHQETMLGDTKQTLTPNCHAQIEAEANYAAGKLLFLGKRFLDEARSVPIEIDSVRTLQKRFGNSLTTTLWRFVEHCTVPCVGAISCHPKYPPPHFDPAEPLRYLIASPDFRLKFAGVTSSRIYAIMNGYCSFKKGGPLGESEVTLEDVDRSYHLFKFSTFSNTYEVLTLGVYLRPCPALG